MTIIVEEIERLRKRVAELEERTEIAERVAAATRNILTLPCAIATEVLAKGLVADPELAHWLRVLPEACAALPPIVPPRREAAEAAAAIAGQLKCPHCGFINADVRKRCRHCARPLRVMGVQS